MIKKTLLEEYAQKLSLFKVGHSATGLNMLETRILKYQQSVKRLLFIIASVHRVIEKL